MKARDQLSNGSLIRNRELIERGKLSKGQALELTLDQSCNLQQNEELILADCLSIDEAIRLTPGQSCNLIRTEELILTGHLSIDKAIGLTMEQSCNLQRTLNGVILGRLSVDESISQTMEESGEKQISFTTPEFIQELLSFIDDKFHDLLTYFQDKNKVRTEQQDPKDAEQEGGPIREKKIERHLTLFESSSPAPAATDSEKSPSNSPR